MVCDDADALHSLFCLPTNVCKLFNPLFNRRKNFYLEDICLVLQHRHSPFYAHSCIYIPLFQFLIFSICELVVLHENIVPYFKILAAAARWITFSAAFCPACVIEHL